MNNQELQNDVNIIFNTGETKTIRYVSDKLIYDEMFGNGRLLTRYWSPIGQVWPETYLSNLSWFPDQPADTFQLAINGKNLAGGFTLISTCIEPDTSRYRSENRKIVHGVITLFHPEQEIEVKVHTRLDGSSFLIRWLEITNKSNKAAGISAVSPMSGMIWSHRYNEHLSPQFTSPFEIAYNHLFEWGNEGDFWFEPLNDGVKVVNGGMKGRSGWGRPAFWIRNLCNGQTFVCEEAWGGNYEFALDCRLNKSAKQGTIFFRMGLSGYDQALRVLLPGETISTPDIHIALFSEDTDYIIQATHEHVRNVVMPEQIPGYHVEIEANHRGYLCDRENEPDIKRDEEVAKAIGTELYVIDAGWYGNDPNQWWLNTGDWHAGSWLPNGLEPISDYACELGMRFGLWVEIEAMGKNSTLLKEHPEWRFTRNGEPVAEGRALDFTNQDVVQWVESEVTRIIEQYKLDMFRIDHNHELYPSGNRRFEGFTEDLIWRYYDNLYMMLDRLRAAFPKVVFQNCAGGGGRLDWGTLSRFHNTELSDWMRMPRGLKILNNISVSLPPEIILRTFGTEAPEHILDADLDTQLRLVCLCRPIFRGIAPSIGELTPDLENRIKHHLEIYRDFIRPVLINGRVFHHTPFLPLYENTPWCVLEYASSNKTHAVIGLFRLSTEGESLFPLRPHGINLGATYKVSMDNMNQSFIAGGIELVQKGLPVILERPLTSELICIEQIEGSV